MLLKIGTRRSPLAMAQTNYIAELIKAKHPDTTFELHTIATIADKDRVSEFHQFGIIGVFSTEHEEQLTSGEVDIVVHSLKDLPTTLREGLVLAAVPERADPRDVLCGSTLADLPQGARVGTGSLRRRSQILSLRPDIEVVPIRGNVGPRLAKINGDDGLDAVILAQAGLQRLGIEGATEVLDPMLFPYAIGQGALGVQARAADSHILAMLKDIEDPKARAEVDCERAMLHALGAGCSLPVGASTAWDGDRLHLHGQITSFDGLKRLTASLDRPGREAVELGLATAEALRLAGGVDVLEASYRSVGAHFKYVGA
ncbi:MAG TPA: hydroxymethylbilane synthase [Bosea sp. (in: a-proteobacteria)]|jgi:hydroxymethylbilane synthase|uniref:hydroxymethylbilane synthase n=1 Tax=Bosea sp. (in: a-proteobacteria) TaxID=1871050 RepID=UPI002E103961|nr:hydroxymethylbilane synthase [Bosea sp. (in: a-proteobacteria)]